MGAGICLTGGDFWSIIYLIFQWTGPLRIMKHFYHGTSFEFDAFDDSKVVTSGPIGACENGRGTYLTADLDFAQGWEGRHNGSMPHTMRIDVSDAAWEQNFIHHDKNFSQKEAANLAAAAAERGYYRAADDIAHVIRRNIERNGNSHFTTALTGKDLAMLSRYNLEIVHMLDDFGYSGFKYTEEGYKQATRDSIVFFHAQDIPSMTVVTLPLDRYKALLEAGAQSAADTSELSRPLAEVFDKIDNAFEKAGLTPEQAAGAKQDILNLTKVALDTKEYDPLKQIHPLKMAELALWDYGKDAMRQTLRKDIGNFVQESMALLGHEFRNPAFEARPVAVPDMEQGFRPDGSLNAFRKNLATGHIASEELSGARNGIAAQHPQLLRQFDRLIEQLHAPGVDFSLRDAMGHAVKRALNGQLTPEGRETTLSNLEENLAYNASYSPRDLGGLIAEAVKFGENLKAQLEAPAAAAAPPAQKSQMKPV